MKLASKGSNRQPRKSLLQLGIALALATTAIDSPAAGLGRLNVLSSIGQPLRAEIELTAVGTEEANSLVARLAAPDAFAQANIDYGSMLNSLRFSVQRRSNGNPYVLVTSTQQINEPFLDVLVELSWGSGRLVREYTVLIDPPGTNPAQRTADVGQAVQPLAPVAPARAPRRAAPPAVASAPGASSAAVPVGRPAPAATGSGTGTDYTVQSGDTALSIVRANRPDGVSLEQMLAALYRDNPQAFAGNVNRLMAGARVRIPDASTAQGLDGAEARRIVAQSSNFGSYRERIAQNAAQAPTGRSGGQQASGQLTTRVEDTSVPTEARDRLQLSRPDVASKPGATGTRSGVGVPSSEELAAKDRELQETKTRLALLEKNVTDLQQLLALKSQTLSDLQKTAQPGAAASSVAPPPTAVTPPVAPTPVVATPVAPSAVTPPPAATALAPAAVETPPAATPAPAPVPAKAAPTPAKVAPTSVPDDSFFSGLMENSLLLVGLVALVVLLVGYFLFTMRRRRKLAGFEDSIFVDNSVLHANSVFGTTGGQSVDTANSGFHSNFVPVAGNLPEQNEVDPVAEADVYIAYGRDAQAEEILKEALRADGSRQAVRLKLLEIYAKRGDAKTFETMASELYATAGGQGEDWKQAAALGQTIDPHNPLYAESAASAPVSMAAPPARNPSSLGSGVGSSLGTGLGAAGLAASDFMASDVHVGTKPAGNEAPPASATEYMRTDPMPRNTTTATSAPSMDLDFDLGFANTGLAPLSGSGAPAPATPPAAPAPVPAAKGNGLDFDVGAGNKPLIDPFTASAFGAGDPTSRTAVNLPAFRARAEQEPPARPDDGFSASDIFGSSIVAEPDGGGHDEPAPRDPTPTPAQARTQDFRNVVDNHQFDKTEPLDAFSNINLDLDNSNYEATSLATEFSGKTDVWQAMATKLDLALAYSDIGDKDGARELLEEVVRNGDQAQADRARQLIGELG